MSVLLQRAALVSLALAMVYGIVATGGVANAGTEAQALPEPEADSVWSYLETANYKSWQLFPGTAPFQQGGSPHGALLTSYVNETARRALTSGTGPLPAGSIIVKENYMPDRALAATTVMYKKSGYNPEHSDWYWLKLAPNGNVDAQGRVDGCQNCHGPATRDYVLTEVKQ